MAKNHKSLVVAELITYSCQLIQSCSKQLSKVFFMEIISLLQCLMNNIII